MIYTWRATYAFTFPTIDRPVLIDSLEFFPAPFAIPLKGADWSNHDGGCIHSYDFKTETADWNGQQTARELANARLAKLAAFAGLCKSGTTVREVSLSLLQAEGCEGAGLSEEAAMNMVGLIGQPFKPAAHRAALEEAGVVFSEVQRLSQDRRALIERGLRWMHRMRSDMSQDDDRLIYIWIAFNCIYNAYGDEQKSAPQDGLRMRGFCSAFPIYNGDDFKGLVHSLTRIGSILDSKGRDLVLPVSSLSRYDGTDATVKIFDLIYGLRNELFHSGRDAHLSSSYSRSEYAVAAMVVEQYLEISLPRLISIL